MNNPFPFRRAKGYMPPRFRATIRSERLLVAHWDPTLSRISPAEAERISELRTAVADLWVQESGGRSELIVRWLVEPPDPSACPDTLREWATSLGYTRLWLPAGLPPLELDRVDAPADVPTHCEWCGWEPNRPDLAEWQRFQSMGIFPQACSRCGNQLPQWLAGRIEVADRGEGAVAPIDDEAIEPTTDPEEAR